VIHYELVQILGPDAITYLTVMCCMHVSYWRTQNEKQHSDLPADVIENEILETLDQIPFPSM
jgi:hypothetical protein